MRKDKKSSNRNPKWKFTKDGYIHDSDGTISGYTIGDTYYKNNGDISYFKSGDTILDSKGNTIGYKQGDIYYDFDGNVITVDC